MLIFRGVFTGFFKFTSKRWLKSLWISGCHQPYFTSTSFWGGVEFFPPSEISPTSHQLSASGWHLEGAGVQLDSLEFSMKSEVARITRTFNLGQMFLMICSIICFLLK